MLGQGQIGLDSENLGDEGPKREKGGKRKKHTRVGSIIATESAESSRGIIVGIAAEAATTTAEPAKGRHDGGRT